MARTWDIHTAATVVVTATVALSFESLYDLARLCEFGRLAGAWPLCLDAVAYLATRLWLRHGQAWKFARALALSAIALSVAANGLVHGLAHTHAKPDVLIVIAVGAVPPIMLALVIHTLVSAGTHPVPVPAAVPVLDVDPVTVPPVPVELPPVPVVPSGSVPDRPGSSRIGQVAQAVPSVPARVVPAVPVPAVHAVPVRPSRPAPVPAVVPAPVPSRVPAAVPGQPAPDQAIPTAIPTAVPERATNAELLARLIEWASRDGRPSVGKVRTAYGVGATRAQKLLNQLDQNQAPTEPGTLHLVPASTGTTDQ